MRSGLSIGRWAAAAIFAVAPISVFAQASAPVVAVLYFDNNSFGRDRADYDGLSKGITDLLITEMATNPSLRVVERDRLQAILQEQQLIRAQSIDPQTAVKLGKLLGAAYLVTGGFMSDGKGTLIVTSRVVSVETGAITNPLKLQGKGDDVLALVGQLSSRLNGEVKLPALPRQTGEARPNSPVESTPRPAPDGKVTRVAQTGTPRPQKLDVKTALLYSKALDEQDNGNAQKAAELYRAVLEKFPDFGPARQNLAKVQPSGD